MTPTLIKPWTITLLVSLLYLGWILSLGGGDPLVFAEIGTRFSQNDPNGSEGYDGQFFYYIAADPAAAPAKIDVPAYRFQRILYPLLARVLSLGSAALIPWLLVALNLAGLVGGVWLTERLLALCRVNTWHALPVGLYAGQLLSLRVDLPEPIALALALLGMWLFERQTEAKPGMWLWSAACFSLAVFTKETMLLAGLAYVLHLFSQRQIKKSALFAAILIIPFSLYQLFLYWWLGQFGVGSGGAGATPFEIIPLGGLFRVTEISWSAFWVLALLLGPTMLLPALWAIYATFKDALAGQRHPWVLVLALNALIILFLPSSTFREPLAMLRFGVPLVAFLILYSARQKSWRALNYSFLWLLTLLMLIKDPLWS